MSENGLKMVGKTIDNIATPIKVDSDGNVSVAATTENIDKVYEKFLDILTKPVAIPKAPLKWELLHKGDSAIGITDIGYDGNAYGVTGSSIFYTTDGGDNLVIGVADFKTIAPSPQSVKFVTKTHRGYVVITCSTSTNVTQVWYSAAFDSGYTKVLESDLGIAQLFNISFYHGALTSTPTAEDSVGLIGLYWQGEGALPSVPRPLFLSKNGGQTWEKILDSVAADTNEDSHFHHACYDPYKGRIIAATGDGPLNSSLRYSDDEGATWKNIDVGAFGIYSQPTLIIPFYDKLILAPDSGPIPGAVLALFNDDKFMTINSEQYIPKHLFSVADTQPSGTFYGQPPYVRSDEVVYIAYWEQVLKKIHIVATGDNGNTWHRIYSAYMGAGKQFAATGITGPDKNGYVFAYFNGGAARLARAKMIEWIKK